MPKNVFHGVRLLSLEIVAGAVIGSCFAAAVVNIHMPWSIPVILALGVWIIYTTDRLLDAKQIFGKPHSKRHRFHKKYFKPLSVAVGICILTAGILLLYLPPATLRFGLLFTAVVVGYFVLVTQPKIQAVIPKEIPAALLYTGGIFLGPISLAESPLATELIILFTQYTLLALSNLLLFALFEKHSDQADGFHSFATAFGEKTTRNVLWVLFTAAAGVMLTVFLIIENPQLVRAQVIVITMTGIMFLIAVFPKTFRHYNLYRLIGDSVFFTPLIYYII